MLILSFLLCLALPSRLLPSGFPITTLCALLAFARRVPCSTHLIFLDLVGRIVFWWGGFVFLPSDLLILLHLSCLFVSLSLSRKYLYARCFESAQLPCYLLWTDGPSNGKSKLKVCFCEVRFIIRKTSIQELKVTLFLPPPLTHQPS